MSSPAGGRMSSGGGVTLSSGGEGGMSEAGVVEAMSRRVIQMPSTHSRSPSRAPGSSHWNLESPDS